MDFQAQQQLRSLLNDCFAYDPEKRPSISQFQQEFQQIYLNYYQNQNNLHNSIRIDAQSITGNQAQPYISFNQKGTQPNNYPGSQVQSPIIFIKDRNSHIVLSQDKFIQQNKPIDQLNIDEFSSIYYTSEHIFISGGKSGSPNETNFQILDTNLNLLLTTKMKYPREEHGMVQIKAQNGNLVYIISGHLNELDDQAKCEFYDMDKKEFFDFEDIVAEVKNFACLEINNKVFAMGGLNSGVFPLNIGQFYDFELGMWSQFEECLPEASATMYGKDKDNIYIFGPDIKTLQFVYEEASFKEIGDKYPGKATSSNAICFNNTLFIFDGQNVYGFDLSTNQWKNY